MLTSLSLHGYAVDAVVVNRLLPALRVAAAVGGFKGFGGPFLSPPAVLASGGALYAFDRAFLWRLHADCFGAVFLRQGPASSLPAREEVGGFAVDRAGQVTLGDARIPRGAWWTSSGSRR